MSEMLQPLEKRLQALALSNKADFPDQHAEYWKRYEPLLANLRRHIYKYINAGLASLSKSPGLYTDHGEDHFDEVVRYAGLLLEDTFSESTRSLKPYELYLLLCAIRLHDAGNIDGRDDHETRANAILMTHGGDIKVDAAEVDLISAIAQAHGGRTIDGNKDTIGELPESIDIGPITVRPRLIAALVRFADEICEHSVRASHHHLSVGTLPDENKLFHLYAKSIVGAKPDRQNKAFKLRLRIDIVNLINKYPTPRDKDGKQESKYLIDDVLSRLDKLNHERVYCNRFLQPEMQTDKLEIEISFFRNKSIAGGQTLAEQCDCRRLTIKDIGYPNVPNDWMSQEPNMRGDQMSALAKKGWVP